MNVETFCEEFATFADAPNGVQKLRELILQLAVQGKLVPQNANDEPASLLIDRARKASKEIHSGTKSKRTKIAGTESLPESMAECAAGWQWTTLSELGSVSPRNDLPDDICVSFLPMASISTEYNGRLEPETRKWGEVKKGFTHVAEGDVAMAKITPCFQNGKTTVMRGLLNGYGAGTTELHVLRPYPNCLIPEYAVIFLRSPQFVIQGVARMSGSAGQQRVPKEHFAESPFPLPPLAEQKRIVAKVDELLALRDELAASQTQRREARTRLVGATLDRLVSAKSVSDIRRVGDNFDLLFDTPSTILQLRQSILQVAVQGKLVAPNSADATAKALLDEVRIERRKLWEEAELAKIAASSKTPKDNSWKDKYEPAAALERDDLPALPSNWIWLSFDEIIPQFQYGPRFGVEEYVSDGIPTVRTTDMDYRGRVGLNDAPKVRIALHAESHWCLQPGDLLITRTGATIGKCALYDESWGKAIASAYLIRFRLTRRTVYPPFVMLFLMSPFGQQLLTSGATETAQPNVNATNISRFPFPLAPLAEQKRIVTKVDQLLSLCDELEAKMTQAESTSNELLSSAVSQLLCPATHSVQNA